MLPTLAGMRTQDEALPHVEKLETETKLTRPTLQRVVNFATFILSTLQEEDMTDEDPKLWTKDLISFGLLPSAGEERFYQYMIALRDSAFSKLDTLARERSAESGVLPAFTGVSTTVELRGVFKKPYKLGSKIEDYTPELLSYRPIVSVAISVDGGVTKTFTFQAAPDELKYIIAELQAAQKASTVLHSKMSSQ
jgi:hypothetical protein